MEVGAHWKLGKAKLRSSDDIRQLVTEREGERER